MAVEILQDVSWYMREDMSRSSGTALETDMVPGLKRRFLTSGDSYLDVEFSYGLVSGDPSGEQRSDNIISLFIDNVRQQANLSITVGAFSDTEDCMWSGHTRVRKYIADAGWHTVEIRATTQDSAILNFIPLSAWRDCHQNMRVQELRITREPTPLPMQFLNLLGMWDAAESTVVNGLPHTLADGDFVTSLQDLSGNGNHLGDSGLGKRPTYVLNAINGCPAVRFDPTTQQYMPFTTPLTMTPAGEVYLYMVVNLRNQTGDRFLITPTLYPAPFFCKGRDGDNKPGISDSGGTFQWDTAVSGLQLIRYKMQSSSAVGMRVGIYGHDVNPSASPPLPEVEQTGTIVGLHAGVWGAVGVLPAWAVSSGISAAVASPDFDLLAMYIYQVPAAFPLNCMGETDDKWLVDYINDRFFNGELDD